MMALDQQVSGVVRPWLRTPCSAGPRAVERGRESADERAWALSDASVRLMWSRLP
jgi:hypothetical protein